MTAGQAPDFRGTYPSAGERIGPAWQTMWDSLVSGEWVKGVNFGARMSEATGLAEATVRSLLRQAAAAGLLETELRFAGKVDGYRSGRKAIRAAWYRRP